MITKTIIISFLLVIVCVTSGHGKSLQKGGKRHFMLPPQIPSGKRSLMDTDPPRGGEGLGKRRFRVPPPIPPGKRSSVLYPPPGKRSPVVYPPGTGKRSPVVYPPPGKRSSVVYSPPGKRSSVVHPPARKRSSVQRKRPPMGKRSSE
ncbi:early nodulin-75-like [Dendronephthya gigantea]|uniref:early nodulin-75-like n=1 Tax=Dendronephthya gigantea TaxID=151771 RepID=UPI00106AD51D|nr:early nodulin-75-like [Dendronephthya gigantea]